MNPLRFALVAVLFALVGVAPVLALPSLDPNHQTQVTVDDLTYLMIKDAERDYRWYYVPPQLRLMEKNGIPALRMLSYLIDGKRNALIQAEVTAAADRQTENRLKGDLQKWYEMPNRPAMPSVDQLEISPVGPLRLSNLYVALLTAGAELIPVHKPGAVSRLVVTPAPHSAAGPTNVAAGEGLGAEDLPVDGAAQSIAAPARAAPNTPPAMASMMFPGATYLTQEMTLMFEVRGLAVEVYKELLSGQSGGLIVLLSGRYEALSVPASVRAELDVRRAQSYFRKVRTESSGSRFLFWGSRRKKVKDYLRESDHLDRSLTLTGIKTEQLSDAEYEAIRTALMSWIAGEVLEPGSFQDPQKAAISLPNASLDIGALSTLFGLPPLSGIGLSIGFNEARGDFTYDFKRDVRHTATATWDQQWVLQEDFVVPGAINLRGYDASVRETVIQDLDLQTRRTLEVMLPQLSLESSRQSLWSEATITLVAPSEQDFWVFARDADGRWRTSALDRLTADERLALAPNRLRVAMSPSADLTGAYADVVWPSLNRYVPSARAEISVKKEWRLRSNDHGVISIDDDFPFDIMLVSAGSAFSNEAGKVLRRINLTLGVDKGRLTPAKRLPRDGVRLPAFEPGGQSEWEFFLGGTIHAVEGKLIVNDLLVDDGLPVIWQASPMMVDMVNRYSELILDPALLNVRTFDVDLRDLDFGEDCSSLEIRVEGERGQHETSLPCDAASWTFHSTQTPSSVVIEAILPGQRRSLSFPQEVLASFTASGSVQLSNDDLVEDN